MNNNQQILLNNIFIKIITKEENQEFYEYWNNLKWEHKRIENVDYFIKQLPSFWKFTMALEVRVYTHPAEYKGAELWGYYSNLNCKSHITTINKSLSRYEFKSIEITKLIADQFIIEEIGKNGYIGIGQEFVVKNNKEVSTIEYNIYKE